MSDIFIMFAVDFKKMSKSVRRACESNVLSNV